MVNDRYIMAPTPIPRWDIPKLNMADALFLFGAGREKRLYAVPPYTTVVPLEFEDYRFEVESFEGKRCARCGATDTFLDETRAADGGATLHLLRHRLLQTLQLRPGGATDGHERNAPAQRAGPDQDLRPRLPDCLELTGPRGRDQLLPPAAPSSPAPTSTSRSTRARSSASSARAARARAPCCSASSGHDADRRRRLPDDLRRRATRASGTPTCASGACCATSSWAWSTRTRATAWTSWSRPAATSPSGCWPSTGATSAQIRDRASDYLARTEVPLDRMDHLPAYFSGGMQQRVQIAKALANSPALVLLDELTTGLDVSVQAGVLDLVRDIQREYGLSAIVVSHDLGVIRLLADRTMVMKNGRVVEQGLTDQILEDPQHPYTQLLVSSAARRLTCKTTASSSCERLGKQITLHILDGS